MINTLIFHSISKARIGPPNILTRSSILSISGFTLIDLKDLALAVYFSYKLLNLDEATDDLVFVEWFDNCDYKMAWFSNCYY